MTASVTTYLRWSGIDAFKEYREARFLKDFHDDPDKWEQLKSGERHVATRLSTEVKSNASSPRAKISSIPLMIRRSIERGEADFGDEDIKSLQLAMDYIGIKFTKAFARFVLLSKK